LKRRAIFKSSLRDAERRWFWRRGQSAVGAFLHSAFFILPLFLDFPLLSLVCVG
jgi:hypothetical protein